MATRPSTDPGRGPSRPGQLYVAAWVFYLVLGLIGLVWIGWRHEVLELELLLDPASAWIDALLGVAGGLLLVGAWELMRRTASGAVELEEKLRELIGAIRRDEAIGLAILSGIAEEAFFRGAVQGSWGFFPATLLFALLHSGPGRAFRFWTFFAAAAGALLGGLMWWRGRLLAPIVAHVVVNGVNLFRLALEGERGDRAQ